MSLLKRILGLFGLCFRKDYDEVCLSNEMLSTKEENCRRQLEIKKLESKNLQEVNSDLHRLVDELKRNNSDLITENRHLKQQEYDYTGTQDLIKGLQTELYSRIKQHEDWGFYGNHAFPGSISVNTRDYVKPKEVRTTKLDNIHTAITGTIVVPDEVTTEINAAKSAREKMTILINFMKEYHVYDKIMEYMIKIPNFEYALTYNDDCTSYQLYYRLVVERPDPNITLNAFDNI